MCWAAGLLAAVRRLLAAVRRLSDEYSDHPPRPVQYAVASQIAHIDVQPGQCLEREGLSEHCPPRGHSKGLADPALPLVGGSGVGLPTFHCGACMV